MKLWKRLLAIPIAACLAIGMLPTPALADDTGHNAHPICGATHKDIGDHTGTCADVAWTAWNGTSEITYDANKTAYVYLEKDATRNNRLIVKAGYTLYLCLNGRELKSSVTSSDAYQGMSQVINVDNGAQFILCDCQGSGTITHSSGAKGKGVRVGGSDPAAATFSMYGGTISGNHADAQCWGSGGAGVEIHNGTFKMYGGTISDNDEENTGSNYGGGGVCAHSSGTFTMYGGTINNNHSVTDAGGVAVVGGTMNIYGGTISNNTADSNGGGIWTNINGFIISGNSVIENNTAVKGGGVYYGSSSNTMTISDSARISGNTATGNGGGIYFDKRCTLTMNGGSITGNTATGDGGGVYFGGDTFSISGGVEINSNTKNSANNNVYLPTSKYITIAGVLTGSHPIGVTTETTPDSSDYVRIASGSKNYAAPENFQYENDGTPVSAIISKYGNTADLIVCQHKWNSTWSSDSFSHWHDCSICKGKEDIAAHTYDQETVNEQYKASSATCLSGTTYYMSCVCGAKGADTFESGGKDPANHSGTLDPDWKSDGSKHWKEYSCCGVHAEEAAHTPGSAATEDAPQICTECGYELAPALEHTHVWGTWISNGDGTHTRTCSKDNSHTEKESCSGGTATCQSSAICSVCNTAYGAKDMTNHTGGTEVRGSVEATTSTEGYTGDTYCKGCDTKLAVGKTIPKKNSGSSGGGSTGGTSGGTGGSSSGGTSGGTGGNTTPSTSVTVPVSGEEKTIRVDAAVNSTTATIEDIDLSKLNTVIGNDVKTGVVTIDFSVLEKQIDTVKLPANVVKQISDAVKDPSNDAESLSIVLTDGTSIEFDEKALSKKTAQTNQTDITISIKRTTDSALSALQQQAVGSQPAWDIKLTSGGKNISDMGGMITLHTPYELRSGEQSNGIVVYYVDENGNRESCETSYDPVKKLISWKTGHLSVYMIGYDESRVTPDTDTEKPDTEDQSELNGNQVSKLHLPILLATGKGGDKKISISWNSYEGADGYDCYWSYCNGKQNYTKFATAKAGKNRVTSRHLDNNRRYKYFVAAYKLVDGKKVYIAKSNPLHVALKDAKTTNAKAVTVNQKTVTLKAGQTFVIKSRTRLENTKKKELLHVAAYRYYTSDQSVASVSKNGKITATKAGTCVIYVVANNGVYATIEVTVN